MALTPFSGTKPQRNDRTTFSTRADAFVTWLLDTFFDELDAGINAFNFNATNSTSTSSLSIGTGTKTIVLAETSRSYVNGMTVKIAKDASNWMVGEVDSYTSGTDTLVVIVRLIYGSGTHAEWTISLAATPQDVGDHHFVCHTPNGHASTDNKIRLYTVTASSAGTALTITHSATLGTYATVNEAGDYEFEMGDSNSGGTCAYGVSVNSNQLTQAVTSITYAHRITPLAINVAASVVIPVKTRTLKLVPGDIVRPHTNGNPNSTDDNAMFSGRKVGNG